jgi:hypothetical protein
MSEFHYVTGTGVAGTLLASPVADCLKGTVYTDVVSLSLYEEALFTVVLGLNTGGTGTALLTVQSCDDFTPTNRVAVEFEYKRVSAGETNTKWTPATSAGVTTTAGSHQTYIVRAKAENQYLDYPNVQLKSVEVVDDPFVGGCSIQMAKPSYDREVLDAVTA